MAFLPDNSLLITSGDGFDYVKQAPTLGPSLLGKIIRNNLMTGPRAHKTIPFYGQDKDAMQSRVAQECHSVGDY